MAQPPNKTQRQQRTEPITETVFLGRWFTGIRRAGFLALLDPSSWHTLSAVISFTSRDGSRRFTADQLAAALGQPRELALRHLDVLAGIFWKDQPLLTLERDAGDVTGAALAHIECLAVSPPPGEDLELQPSHTLPAELMRELGTVGLNHAQIDSLAKRFPEDEIRRQLDWLPSRGARNPAALLIRAIEQAWDEPKEGV